MIGLIATFSSGYGKKGEFWITTRCSKADKSRAEQRWGGTGQDPNACCYRPGISGPMSPGRAISRSFRGSEADVCVLSERVTQRLAQAAAPLYRRRWIRLSLPDYTPAS